MNDPIDDHVRLFLRMRRKVLGLTVEALAEAIDVPVEEVRACERGAQRISASMLFRMTRALGCKPSDLFEGLTAEQKPRRPDA